ncbi:hypothetical protein SARC_02435 [Sphaeroforma arctica JP610]|uniref:Uncharacterized protein n=1 Tax=Sphaeroforma arctica JP610 TaxID=667725 RepID=A0A0L0G8L0_9EUKA|nr:hypothetical protein SARC_02435 [Sphaeroforma arctica JP610]KNC85377.1 hypothetical protein SARC_02435 [Sphaeroforma arctica JP610]|eukprot:XP_014159279.1 hypothetical protein SARC_02435 [Sphaeroforma arctica JP610]
MGLYNDAAYDKDAEKYINAVVVKLKLKPGVKPTRQIYRTEDLVLQQVETENVLHSMLQERQRREMSIVSGLVQSGFCGGTSTRNPRVSKTTA